MSVPRQDGVFLQPCFTADKTLQRPARPFERPRNPNAAGAHSLTLLILARKIPVCIFNVLRALAALCLAERIYLFNTLRSCVKRETVNHLLFSSVRALAPKIPGVGGINMINRRRSLGQASAAGAAQASAEASIGNHVSPSAPCKARAFVLTCLALFNRSFSQRTGGCCPGSSCPRTACRRISCPRISWRMRGLSGFA
jgi:hypothetical protein